MAEKAKKGKPPVTARQRAKKGALVSMVLFGGFYLIFAVALGANGGTATQVLTTLLTGVVVTLVSPLYGIGYVFGLQRTMRWAAAALHYGGHALDAGFIWWICTGSKKGLVRGFLFAFFLLAFAVGIAWIPGLVDGIRQLREEKKAEGAVSPVGNKTPPVRSVKPAETPIEKLTEKPGGSTTAAARTSVMEGISGEFAGAVFDMKAVRQLTIGRNPSQCSVVVPDSGISRVHCVVEYRQDGIYVKDMSTNGTFWQDGRPLPKNMFAKAAPGSAIRLGSSGPEFSFR